MVKIKVIIIIPAEYRTTLNAIVVNEFGSTNTNLFRTELFLDTDTAQTTPSHYLTTQNITPEVFVKLAPLKNLFPGCEVEAYDMELNPNFSAELLAVLGLAKKIPVM